MEWKSLPQPLTKLLLPDFFTQTTISSQPENSTEQAGNLAVHCKSLVELIDKVLLSRKVFSDHLIKVEIDGGGGFLRVCLGIIGMGQGEDVSSPLSKQLLTQRIAKDSGVKQQLIVAIAEELPENYLNVKHIWSLIQANSSKFIISCDLKLANIMCGLQNHASSHPCTWCDVDSRCLSSCGSIRTLGSLMNCYQAFKRSGGDVRVAKSFGNVFHEPIITGSSDSLILELIPPMELHLLLGVVNHLYKSLKNVWPKASQWPAALYIDEEPFHGGHFAGNQCYKLLNNLDLLQHLAEKDSASRLLVLWKP